MKTLIVLMLICTTGDPALFEAYKAKRKQRREDAHALRVYIVQNTPRHVGFYSLSVNVYVPVNDSKSQLEAALWDSTRRSAFTIPRYRYYLSTPYVDLGQ